MVKTKKVSRLTLPDCETVMEFRGTEYRVKLETRLLEQHPSQKTAQVVNFLDEVRFPMLVTDAVSWGATFKILIDAETILEVMMPIEGEMRRVYQCEHCGQLIGRRFIPHGIGRGIVINPCL